MIRNLDPRIAKLNDLARRGAHRPVVKMLNRGTVGDPNDRRDYVAHCECGWESEHWPGAKKNPYDAMPRDSDRGMALAERIEAGIVHISDQPIDDEPQVPFGGVKDSGYGRFGGGEAMHEFTEMRWVTVQGQGGRPFPF